MTNSWRPFESQSCSSQQTEAVQRPFGLRALHRIGIGSPHRSPMADAQEVNSDVARLLTLDQTTHFSVWTRNCKFSQLPKSSLDRYLTSTHLANFNVDSSLIAALLSVLLIATALEELLLSDSQNENDMTKSHLGIFSHDQTVECPSRSHCSVLRRAQLHIAEILDFCKRFVASLIYDGHFVLFLGLFLLFRFCFDLL